MIDISNVENIVFEGGGVKAFAFIGVMEYLEEKGIMGKIKRVIGSSAGSIFATAVATKMSTKSIKTILQDTDFASFKDDSWGYIPDVLRVWNYYGFCKGDSLYEWFGKMLSVTGNSPDVTFLDLYHKTGIELVITGTNLNKAKTEYFSYETRPQMPIRLALRISTSIPLFFKAVQYEGDIWVDGGTLNPYPLWYFDTNAGLEENTIEALMSGTDRTDCNSQNEGREKTIGFKLLNSDEIIQDGSLESKRKTICNIKHYAFALIDSMFYQIERGYIKDDYWKRTIPIYVGTVDTTDFDLSRDTIEKLISAGKNATIEYIC